MGRNLEKRGQLEREIGRKPLRPKGFRLNPKVRLWARQDLNLQPTDYESAALTGLSYGPEKCIASRRFRSSPPIHLLAHRPESG